MDPDEVNQAHERTVDAWLQRLGKYNTDGIQRLASQYRNGDTCSCVKMKNGSFNWCFKVVFDDGLAWAVRFPVAGNVMHTEEKVRREVAIMKFIKEKTSIPVPAVIAFGMASDNHDPQIGPFIITEWIEGVPLSDIMEKLPRPPWGPILREDMDDETLYTIYRQISSILLELSMHNFDKIGALSLIRHDDGTTSWPILSRPMTLKMNEIERSGYVAVDDHFLQPFRTTTEYIDNLIQQNITHLCKQRNSIDDADDARRKYILRQRLKALTPYFVLKDYDSKSFKLLCDDFRPGNILVNKETLKIVAVIDWEWTYTAPYQFSFSPPSWLILANPTSWTYRSEALYKAKFSLFLKSLEDEEAQRENEMTVTVPADQKMSTLMRQSMEDGRFWFNELVRESFNFDEDVQWPNIEPLLEKNGLAAVGLPSEVEVEAFVKMKIEDLSQYKLDRRVLKDEKAIEERQRMANKEKTIEEESRRDDKHKRGIEHEVRNKPDEKIEFHKKNTVNSDQTSITVSS